MRKRITFSAIVLIAFFGLAEGLLALLGVDPASAGRDPFVGFAGNSPLFVPAKSDGGRSLLRTASGKLAWFNDQSFPAEKDPGTYRVFCVGGSTTYGRPYDDRTSFCGWLRELLPAADESKRWEVINAGGISYASYRVVRVVDELLTYDPDVLVVYTGHNEFLERRTYPDLLNSPTLLREAAAWVSRLRLAGAVQSVLHDDRDSKADRTVLPEEVAPILEQSVGPSAYRREILETDATVRHFRHNLEQMIERAHDAGVTVVLVTPAGNVQDFSPFKSQHRSGLSADARRRWVKLVAEAEALAAAAPEDALDRVDAALAIDSSYADLHFLHGTILHDLRRYRESKQAFERAIATDVCPLRAIPQLQEAVRDIGRRTDCLVVDYDQFLAGRCDDRIPGNDFFLDHVHPTIDAHRLLALEIIGRLAQADVVALSDGWGESAVAAIERQIFDSIDEERHALALRNLSKVLAWAGKTEEADVLALRAVERLGDDAETLFQAGSAYVRMGQFDEALASFGRAIEIDPQHARSHYGIGVVHAERDELAEAIAAFESSLQIDPNSAPAHYNLGRAYEAAGKLASARSHYEAALAINPDDSEASNNLGVVLARQSKLADAETYFRKSIQHDPRNADAMANLGQLLLMQGKDEQARIVLKRALQIDPHNRAAQAHLESLGRHPEKRSAQ